MARLITSGGELRDHITSDINSPDGWSAGAVATTTETTNYRSGDSAFACAGAAGSTSFRAWSYTAPALASNLYARVYLRVSALPSAAARVVAFVTAADAALVSVRLNTDGTFALWNDAGAAQIGSNTGTVLQVDSWYRVLLRLNIGTGAIDQAEMRVVPDSPYDVEETVSGTALTISDTHSARLRAGWIDAPGVTSTMLLDDIAVNDATGTTKQNTFPTNGSVFLILPEIAGAMGSWTDCSGAATASTFPTYIDNRPPQGLADHTTAGHAGATAHQVRMATTSTSTVTVNLTTNVERGLQIPLDMANTTGNTTVSYIGDAAARTQRAQSFVYGTGVTIHKVGLAVWKVGTPTDGLTIEIQDDAAGLPSGNVLATGTLQTTITAENATTAHSSSNLVKLSTPVALTPGARYWIVARRTGALDAVNYYAWARAGTHYAALSSAVNDGTTWAQTGTSYSTNDHAIYVAIAQPAAVQRVLQPIVCHGQSVTGAKSGTVQGAAPTIGSLTFTFANNTGVSGTYPSNWYWTRGTILYDKSNTTYTDLRASLVVSAIASSGVKLMAFAGLHIETEVQLQGWLRWQKSADSTFWWGKRSNADTDYELSNGTVFTVEALNWAMYPEPQITAGQDFPATLTSVQDAGGFPTGHIAA